MGLDHSVAVVTGASRGIGRSIALHLAREGAEIALASRSLGDLEEVQREIQKEGGKAVVVPTDVAKQEQVALLVERVEEHVGPIDLLVNNAGRIQAVGPAWEVDPDVWWSDMAVNLYGTFLCCREVVPRMLKRGHGRIITLIGGGTAAPFANGSGYATSKAAIMRYTECLALELRDTGVRVFAMSPGFVRTALNDWVLTTETGKKFMPELREAMEQGQTVSAEHAGKLAAQLASGRFDAFHGRAIEVGDDLEEVLANEREIIEKDQRTLRMT